MVWPRAKAGGLLGQDQSLQSQVHMRPLGLLFLGGTSAPVPRLLQPTKALFALLSAGVGGFDFTGREGQDVRPPVAAAVFDHQPRLFNTP
jgi:hypothetical protein